MIVWNNNAAEDWNDSTEQNRLVKQELNELVSRANEAFKQAAGAQREIEIELDALLAALPTGVALSPHDYIRVQAAIEARDAFNDLKSVVRRVRSLAKRINEEMALPEGNADSIPFSAEAFESGNHHPGSISQL